VTYTTSTYLGGPIVVTATIANSGNTISEPIKMQFTDLKDYADLVGCNPTCSTYDFFGDIYAQFSGGVPPGTTVIYEVEFIATQIGAAHWSVLMYQGGTDDFYYGGGTTTIQ